MKPFWREEELTQAEQMLVALLYTAHQKSTFRNNISTNVAINSAVGSGGYCNGIAAAILTLGGVHAPLLQGIEFLNGIVETPLKSLPGGKVPGWGNSFIKGEKDPDWLEVDAKIKELHPQLYSRIEGVTNMLHKAGKEIYPNPGCYTAATAIILRMPAPIAPFLFVSARLEPWSYAIMQNLVKQEGGE